MLLSLRYIMIISHFLKKNTVLLLFLFLSGIYISLVWNNNVWMDEAFTASLVNTSFRGVIDASMADTLPPLYNICLWLMTAVFSYSIPVMKITSVIPMIASLALSATVAGKRWGKRSAVILMLCLTFMPLMLYYGVEIRMYSMGFFFAFASGVYAYEVAAEGTKKNWILFTVLSVLAGYTHHFAFVTVAFAYLFLLLFFVFLRRDRIKEWFICILATFIMYLPCLIVTLRQISRVSGYFSMPDVDAGIFIQYALYPFTVGVRGASILCALMVIAAVILFLHGVITKKDAKVTTLYLLFCLVTYYGVLIFGTVISKIMTANIFVDRYLFFSAGLLWLFVAVILGRSDNRVFYAALAASAVIGVFTYTVEYRVEYGNSADEEIAFLRENISEGDIYFSIGGHEEMQNCIPFYTYLDKDTHDLTFVTPLETAVERSQEAGTTLWVSVLEGFAPADDDMKVLRDHGLTLKKEADFEFDRYRCEMYKVIRGTL